jgi:hypothetical protein
MHHYGEDAVRVEISKKNFNILIQNHDTGAVITVSGPLKGIFEEKDQEIDLIGAEGLGREVAHLLRKFLIKKKGAPVSGTQVLRY